MSLNDNESINDNKDKDRDTLFTSYNEDIKPDDTDNDININNDRLNTI